MMQSPYDRLASEYYDARHKTCRNFDSATIAAIAVARPTIPKDGLILEVGCGRGRCGEFLGIPWQQVVQLDSSERMLELHHREKSLVKVCADATAVPLASAQFAAVVGFLVDPFMGLSFLSEMHRLLRPGGLLFVTTPSETWGVALRGSSDRSRCLARFIDKNNQTIDVPSVLFSSEQLDRMTAYTGFHCIQILNCALPEGVSELSPDIEGAAAAAGKPIKDFPILTVVQAEKLK